MSLGGILILVVLLIALIAFIYLIVKTARGWGILHTLLLCTLFIECWVFMVFSAGVQATRVRFTEQAAKQQDRARNAVEQTQQLRWGPFDTLNYDAVVPAKSELQRMTSDRGRVWRGVTLLQTADSSFQLELSAEDTQAVDDLAVDPAEGVASESITSESLPVDLVVYAFAEEVNEEGRPIPSFYLGEFTVVQSQDGAVTLEPTLQLSQAQIQFIQSGAASSWALYELMPIDGHLAFAAPGSQPSEEEVFGRMDAETLADLLANVPMENGRQERVLQSYLRDGQKAQDGDPADSVWVQLRLKKNYSLDVDSQESANATERGYFDATGRSIDARLKRQDEETENSTVELKENDLILLTEAAARPLIANGTAELVERYFVRPLNDYEQAFNNQDVRLNDVQERIDVFNRETELLNQANARGQELISIEQVENQKLTQDLENYSKEVEVVTTALQDAKGDLQKLKAELAQLYRAIQAQAPAN